MSAQQNPPAWSSQVLVAVTIVGIDQFSKVAYTYTNPKTGKHHVQKRHCRIMALEPYQTVFALDYATTRNGWYFDGPAVPVGLDQPRPSDLLISFPQDSCRILVTYLSGASRFILNFRNLATGQCVPNDPQEGNILRPTMPDGQTHQPAAGASSASM